MGKMELIKEKRSFLREKKLLPYLLIVPTVICISMVVLYPIVLAFVMSFFRSDLLRLDESAKFVGLKNYHQLFFRREFWISLKLTLVYAGGTVGGSYILGLFTALLLNFNYRGRGFARGIMIVPWAVPCVVAVLVWTWMYDPQFGILNYFLMKIGLIQTPCLWLSDTSLAMISILGITIWQFYPIATVLLLSGLQTIPTELYEAARIDGANQPQTFRYITLPGLRYVSNILIVLLTIWGFGKFVYIYLMTQGGPAKATMTLVIRTYLNAFKFFNVGSATAMGMVLFFLAVIFSAIFMYLTYEPQI